MSEIERLTAAAWWTLLIAVLLLGGIGVTHVVLPALRSDETLRRWFGTHRLMLASLFVVVVPTNALSLLLLRLLEVPPQSARGFLIIYLPLAVALVGVTLALLYLAGCRVAHLLALAAAALPVLAAAIWVAPYRLRRIATFLDPWSDARGAGFQIIQSWLALGSGGWLGRGIGESRQKLFYLPEAHTDFIFAVVGEELGFVGAVAVVALFAVLVWRGLRVGLRAPDPFGAYLALGVTVLVATQTLVNLGVVTGTLPTKGLPLPFISFGGSALLTTMLATGLLLNVSQHAHV